jgi:hypothetical protein
MISVKLFNLAQKGKNSNQNREKKDYKLPSIANSTGTVHCSQVPVRVKTKKMNKLTI